MKLEISDFKSRRRHVGPKVSYSAIWPTVRCIRVRGLPPTSNKYRTAIPRAYNDYFMKIGGKFKRKPNSANLTVGKIAEAPPISLAASEISSESAFLSGVRQRRTNQMRRNSREQSSIHLKRPNGNQSASISSASTFASTVNSLQEQSQFLPQMQAQQSQPKT